MAAGTTPPRKNQNPFSKLRDMIASALLREVIRKILDTVFPPNG